MTTAQIRPGANILWRSHLRREHTMHTDKEQATPLGGGAGQHDQGDPAQHARPVPQLDGPTPELDRGEDAPQPGKVSLMEVIGMFGGCSSGL